MQKAILLVGPTGSGKTPLGEYLQDNGIFGVCCHHFDFGENLRRVSAGAAAGFSASEIAFVEDVVHGGVLLEDSAFHVAVRILDSFCSLRGVEPKDLLIMNGLPRHIGQAEALASRIRFMAVLQLRCSPDTVRRRLLQNSGGDRSLRTDDDLALVERKLVVYERRTAPLVDYYRSMGIPVIRFTVSVQSDPGAILRESGEDLKAIVSTSGARTT
jgi:adenylate kinase